MYNCSNYLEQGNINTLRERSGNLRKKFNFLRKNTRGIILKLLKSSYCELSKTMIYLVHVFCYVTVIISYVNNTCTLIFVYVTV